MFQQNSARDAIIAALNFNINPCASVVAVINASLTGRVGQVGVDVDRRPISVLVRRCPTLVLPQPVLERLRPARHASRVGRPAGGLAMKHEKIRLGRAISDADAAFRTAHRYICDFLAAFDVDPRRAGKYTE
ncbi:hypothetical protein H0E84_03825 [Luteimonas sp. SJ-92]|uniref:Uncharacterized protein n=1 Tax=Luteimonas salinisoli TaxID=2752307 RepID=A0A853J9P6_9GAMM|nr:hypothetical protein [Luteimonas salinisoli]NZA25502.1 hypothetical protein [Luteimonas salinisoli]